MQRRTVLLGDCCGYRGEQCCCEIFLNADENRFCCETIVNAEENSADCETVVESSGEQCCETFVDPEENSAAGRLF